MQPETALAAPAPLWKANSKPQERFLETGAYEALYGGAAGGGKSDALLVGALRYVHEPRYHALLLRRTFQDLERTLIKRSLELYPRLAERPVYNGSHHVWRFPSGARVEFGHLQHEKDVLNYQGAELQYIGFDELTHFTEGQYRYLLSRGRSATTPGRARVPVRIRASTNPGGEGHAWVMARWAPWLWREPGTPEMPRWEGPRAKSGELLHYRLHDDGREEYTSKAEDTFGRIFIGAKATDNPDCDPVYVRALNAQDAVTRAQLRDGDWLARPAAGVYFKRGWFRIVDAVPADGVLSRWRAWDRAATPPHEGNKDPDWTVGVKIARVGKLFYVEDVTRDRDRPMAIERLMLTTAHLDGRDTSIHIFRDPGSAGVAEEERMLALLAGFDVHSGPNTGDKISRARPFSAQAEAGNVVLVRGAWNEEFVRELEAFPEGSHDDQVDAGSAAFTRVAPTSDLEFALAMSTL